MCLICAAIYKRLRNHLNLKIGKLHVHERITRTIYSTHIIYALALHTM